MLALAMLSQSVIREARDPAFHGLNSFIPNPSKGTSARDVPAAVLGRPARHSLARAWVSFFAKTEFKGLHESLVHWLSSAQDPQVPQQRQL